MTGAVHTIVVNKDMKIARLPSQMANETPSNSGTAILSILYATIDTANKNEQTAFSRVLIGKLAFSNVRYLMKKYVSAIRRMKPRLSITFWGMEKCCIKEVPPHRGTWTKKRWPERGTSCVGVDLMSHGMDCQLYWWTLLGVPYAASLMCNDNAMKMKEWKVNEVRQTIN